jgi:hypothetical protein
VNYFFLWAPGTPLTYRHDGSEPRMHNVWFFLPYIGITGQSGQMHSRRNASRTGFNLFPGSGYQTRFPDQCRIIYPEGMQDTCRHGLLPLNDIILSLNVSYTNVTIPMRSTPATP